MKKLNFKLKNNRKGITLIALVITIIVLLILAGVTIATLTGDNGILTKANDAKTSTKIAGAKEKVQMEVAGSIDNHGQFDMDKLKENLKKNLKLPDSAILDNGDGTITVIVDGYEVKIDANGKVTVEGEEEETPGGGTEIGTLPSTEDTTPFLPEGAEVTNNDLDTGLTIKDSNGNEWVWIIVPKSEMPLNLTFENVDDYNILETNLQLYTKEYKDDETYVDIWYDGEGNPKDENSNLDDTDGCGLTYTEYNNLKQKMLKSTYENGGFYIGKYEVGSDRYVTSLDNTRNPAIKEGIYSYNYVECNQAQELSESLSTGGKNSSLMFGIQWDLVLKYIENNATELGDSAEERKQKILEDSSIWGNYWESSFEITKGEYSEDYGENFVEVNQIYEKKAKSSVLLTTGATSRNSVLNIYDLAGGFWEWTLEYTGNCYGPSAVRGGIYFDGGNIFPAAYRHYQDWAEETSFRPTLF